MFLCKNKKIIENLPLKIFIFYNFKKLCIFHGCVFVMFYAYKFEQLNLIDQKYSSFQHFFFFVVVVVNL